MGRHSGFSRASHTTDAHCCVDPKTDCCVGCGIYHGDPCPLCGGRGFHAETCEHQRNDQDYDDKEVEGVSVGDVDALHAQLDEAVSLVRRYYRDDASKVSAGAMTQTDPLFIASGDFPKIGAGGTLCKVKLFTPDSSWTWYITECGEDDDPDMCFGLAVGHEAELGYFHLSELREARGRFGLPIERDLHYKPEPLAVVVERHSKWGVL